MLYYNTSIATYIGCGERTGVLGGVGAVVAHGSCGLVPCHTHQSTTCSFN